MPKYLVKASYTPGNGTKGLLTDGGTKRVKAVEQLVESVGGKLEAFYFAYGEADAYVIMDVPDSISATAVSLTVSASGLAHCSTIVLITPEEMDAATEKSPRYNAPGSAG